MVYSEKKLKLNISYLLVLYQKGRRSVSICIVYLIMKDSRYLIPFLIHSESKEVPNIESNLFPLFLGIIYQKTKKIGNSLPLFFDKAPAEQDQKL
jgi:hypothetical protein